MENGLAIIIVLGLMIIIASIFVIQSVNRLFKNAMLQIVAMHHVRTRDWIKKYFNPTINDDDFYKKGKDVYAGRKKKN